LWSALQKTAHKARNRNSLMKQPEVTCENCW